MTSETDVQVVIVAGGLGTRLLPLTRSVPKSLVEVGGKPFLEHQISLLRTHGFTKFLLLTGYLASEIERVMADGEHLGVEISYSREEEPLGTGGALLNAADKLGPEFLLLYGDTYLDIDYRDLVRAYTPLHPAAMLVASTESASRVPKNLEVSPDNRVVSYDKKDPRNKTHLDAGAGIFSREVLSHISPGRVCSLEEEVYHKLAAAGQMWAYQVAEPSYDMGTFQGLEALESKIANDRRPNTA